MFKVVARLVIGSNRVGFMVDRLDLEGNFQERLRLSDDQIKSLMYIGEIFDITFDNKGFRFKNESLKLSDLPIIRI